MIFLYLIVGIIVLLVATSILSGLSAFIEFAGWSSLLGLIGITTLAIGIGYLIVSYLI